MCKIILTSSPLFSNHTMLFGSKKKRTKRGEKTRSQVNSIDRDSNVTAGSQGILEHEQNEH